MKEWTALHIAIFNNQEAAAECLLKAGADVDCPDSEVTYKFIWYWSVNL